MNPVVKYFTGEKTESYLFIILGIISLLTAAYLILAMKTTFWKGVSIPFILVAILELSVGFTLVKRSPEDITRLKMFITKEPLKIKTDEIPRMKKVMRNFLLFRYFEVALIFLGIILMYSSLKDTFWRGLGLGLFLKASIVLSLDFFAERRGHIYENYLLEFAEKL